jgi:hypothetical protein
MGSLNNDGNFEYGGNITYEQNARFRINAININIVYKRQKNAYVSFNQYMYFYVD